MKPQKLLAVGAALAMGMGLLIVLFLAGTPVGASPDAGSDGDALGAGAIVPDVGTVVVATNTLRIQPTSIIVDAGTVFTTHVVINDAQNLGGVEYTLEFPATIVQGRSVELGSFPGSSGRTIVELPPAGDPISNAIGTVSHGYFSFGAQPGPDGGGIIASIAFTATANGSGVLDLVAAQATDTAGQLLTPTLLFDGQVAVFQPEVEICCDSDLSGPPGSEVKHTFTLTNTGDYTDTFALTYEGDTWPTSGPSSIGPLAPDEPATFEVTVVIPGDATGDDSDWAIVTATSNADPTVTATAQMTTRAEAFRVYLPLALMKSQ